MQLVIYWEQMEIIRIQVLQVRHIKEVYQKLIDIIGILKQQIKQVIHGVQVY